jgi:hypothetical protein
VQGVRRVKHLRAQSAKDQVQGLRRGEHLRAQAAKEPVQGVRRGEHLRAQAEKERVQGVRRGEHLRAQAEKEQVQGVRCHMRRGQHLSTSGAGALARRAEQVCSRACLDGWRSKILNTSATVPRGALQSCTEARMIPCAWQLHHAHAQQAAAKASCMKNKKLGATCIGLDNQ